MSRSKRSETSRLVRILFLLLLFAAPLLLFWQRNYLYDSWRLHGYQPPSAVAKLADDTKMTDSSRHIFYVNHPQLMSDARTFRQACTTSEQTIILGCYRGPENGIYIYNVQDSRLAGIQQVTAAHEMLHGAYDRLSTKDRDYVNGLLLDYFSNGLRDQRIKDTIESYKKTEPKDLVNEMHSIFGTEVKDLPQPLENYYKRYFSDRTAITTFSANYEGEFRTRESQAKNLEAQLQKLKSTVDTEEAALKAEYNDINSRRAQLDSQRQTDVNAYNASVDSFNDQVADYNAKIAAYKADVARYNRLVKQYNDVAGDLRSLYDSINANLQTTSGQ
jgi:hypothetical protein